jgi:hypothetical protein
LRTIAWHMPVLAAGLNGAPVKRSMPKIASGWPALQ